MSSRAGESRIYTLVMEVRDDASPSPAEHIA